MQTVSVTLLGFHAVVSNLSSAETCGGKFNRDGVEVKDHQHSRWFCQLVKERLRMQCIQKWHQEESQNSGKSEYGKGHNFSMVSKIRDEYEVFRL